MTTINHQTIQLEFLDKLIELADADPEHRANYWYVDYKYDTEHPDRSTLSHGCIVGTAVEQLGLMTLEELQRFDIDANEMFEERDQLNPVDGSTAITSLNKYIEIIHGVSLVSDDMLPTVINVQEDQDNGQTWGLAVERLKKDRVSA